MSAECSVVKGAVDIAHVKMSTLITGICNTLKQVILGWDVVPVLQANFSNLIKLTRQKCSSDLELVHTAFTWQS